MNGAADMGGMHGFGPIEVEPNEPVFHADWERRAFALTMAMFPLTIWTLDKFRFARESLPPPQYLGLSYYGLWVVTLENLLVEHGIATREEIAAGHALAPVAKAVHTVAPEDVMRMIRIGSHYDRPVTAPARFSAGDVVRTRNMHPETHTRLPRYARGHLGEVVRVIGYHVFPDSKASSAGEDPQWLYTVRFDGCELWGSDSDRTVKVCIDAWDPYLEPA
jgi:nitrile hydratase subunit beta